MVLPEIGISKSLERTVISGQKPIMVRFPTNIETLEENNEKVSPLIMRKF